MKKILFVILLFVVSPVKADDWLLSLSNIAAQAREAAGHTPTATSYLTDTLAKNLIREGFVAVNTALQPIRTVNSIVCTKYQNSYQLDTLQMGIYSVEWVARDTVTTLVYAARETWKTISKVVSAKLKPGFYDFDHDSIYIHPTPISADTILIHGWEKVANLGSIDSLAFLDQAYRLAVLKYVTWQAAMARQHPMAGEFKAQYYETLENLKAGLGRGVPVEPAQ